MLGVIERYSHRDLLAQGFTSSRQRYPIFSEFSQGYAGPAARPPSWPAVTDSSAGRPSLTRDPLRCDGTNGWHWVCWCGTGIEGIHMNLKLPVLRDSTVTAGPWPPGPASAAPASPPGAAGQGPESVNHQAKLNRRGTRARRTEVQSRSVEIVGCQVDSDSQTLGVWKSCS